MRKPSRSIDLGGGVWRIRQHPVRQHLLATACMGNGFHVVDSRSHEVLAHYSEHASLAYGVDWKAGDAEDKDLLVASCSFYDHLLTLWTVSMS
jgi:diphthamide biosynthesis protein 7